MVYSGDSVARARSTSSTRTQAKPSTEQTSFLPPAAASGASSAAYLRTQRSSGTAATPSGSAPSASSDEGNVRNLLTASATKQRSGLRKLSRGSVTFNNNCVPLAFQWATAFANNTAMKAVSWCFRKQEASKHQGKLTGFKPSSPKPEQLGTWLLGIPAYPAQTGNEKLVVFGGV